MPRRRWKANKTILVALAETLAKQNEEDDRIRTAEEDKESEEEERVAATIDKKKQDEEK